MTETKYKYTEKFELILNNIRRENPKMSFIDCMILACNELSQQLNQYYKSIIND